MRLSRNSQCPCNSGFKYKKCCEGKLSNKLESYYALLQREGIIRAKLRGMAESYYNKEELDGYCREFNNKTFEEFSADEELFFLEWFFNEAIDKKENKKVTAVLKEVFVFDLEEHKIIDEWLNNSQAGIFEVQSVNEQEYTFVK